MGEGCAMRWVRAAFGVFTDARAELLCVWSAVRGRMTTINGMGGNSICFVFSFIVV